MAEKKPKQIGEVSNYFKNVKAAAIKLTASLKVGDKIKIVGGEKEVEMDVNSMQIDREDIEKAKKGDEIGLLVPEDVHKGNKVFKI
jgi:translation elongation factor EF-1alpha